MDISLENSKTLNPTINIRLVPGDYQDKVEQSLKSYRSKVSLNGFRKGKVPVGMVRKMYGKQIVFEEINHALGNALDNYIKTEKLNILGEPLIDESSLIDFNFAEPGDLEVKYEIGLMPEIKHTYKAGKVQKYKVEVSDDSLETLIDEMQVKYGKVEDSDVLSEDGCAELQFTELANKGLEKEEGINTKKMILVKDINQKTAKNKILKLDINGSVELNLFKIFESKEFIAQHILGISEDQLEQVSDLFKLTLIRKCKVEKAELNEEFFNMVLGPGKAKSADEFKKLYSEKLDENYARMTSERFYKEVVDGLVENIKIDLPDTFLKKWLAKTPQNKLTSEDVEANYDKYQSDIKEQIILDSLLNENELKIEGVEINAKMDEQIRQMFYLPEDAPIEGNEQLMAYRKNMMGNQEYINYTVEMIRREKLVKLFEEKVKFTEKKIKAEDFLKLDK